MNDRRKLDGQDRRRAARQNAARPVNPSTLRSRRARAIAKQNRRDPVRAYRVWLPQSTTDRIILGLKTIRPEDRYRLLSERTWEKQFEQVLRYLIEEAIKSKK